MLNETHESQLLRAEIPLGAVIYAKRPLYRHYGVYVGGNLVVNFVAKGKVSEISAKEAFIQESTLEEFLEGDELFIEKDSGEGFSPEETVARAKSHVGKLKGEYSLVFNNCEHFAHWCKYGKKKSGQVEKAVAVAVALGVSVLSGLTAVIAGKRKTES